MGFFSLANDDSRPETFLIKKNPQNNKITSRGSSVSSLSMARQLPGERSLGVKPLHQSDKSSTREVCNENLINRFLSAQASMERVLMQTEFISLHNLPLSSEVARTADCDAVVRSNSSRWFVFKVSQTRRAARTPARREFSFSNCD